MKRLLALLAGGLGLGALLRRSRRPALSTSPADDLRAKLQAAKSPEGGNEPPVGEPPDVDARRAEVQARARRAVDELGEP